MPQTGDAKDTVEFFHDTDYEMLMALGKYHVLASQGGECALTPDAGNMTVDIAAGSIVHNSSQVEVAAQANGVTLVADGSNPRWAIIWVDSSGVAQISHGTAAVTPNKPELPDGVVLAMVLINNGDTQAATIDSAGRFLDKRLFLAKAGGGAGMDWAIRLTGDPEFPYNGDTATDVTISSNTTWTESNYPGRIVKLDVLTINSGIVLTLQGGPWYLFVASIVYGNTSSIISANGFTSTDSTAQSSDYARGGVTTQWGGSGVAVGGSGAGMVFVVATVVSGAAGQITANGGAGFRNTTATGADNSIAGQGVLSDTNGFSANGEGATTVAARYYPNKYTLLGRGGSNGTDAIRGHAGGGGGHAEATGAGGGSGIGGGGGVDSDAGGAATAGELPLVSELSIDALLSLAADGCLGGGGGAGHVSTTGAHNGAGGGGGGSVVAFVRTLTTTPTVSANGGAATTNGAAGGAGVAYLVDVP